MRVPEKSELPLETSPDFFVIDEKRVRLFQKAFRSDKIKLPPTIGAVALKGVFRLLDHLKVDWKKLLHATQSFEFHKKMECPVSIRAETNLVDARYRSKVHWLQFETKIFDGTTLAITSRSLILVRTDDVA